MPATATASRKPKGYDVDLGQAHESALKEAETDAMEPQARAAVAGPDDLRESGWPCPLRQGAEAGQQCCGPG